jgi:hypothetical protein
LSQKDKFLGGKEQHRETRAEFLGQKLKFSGGKEVPKILTEHNLVYFPSPPLFQTAPHLLYHFRTTN